VLAASGSACDIVLSYFALRLLKLLALPQRAPGSLCIPLFQMIRDQTPAESDVFAKSAVGRKLMFNVIIDTGADAPSMQILR
jgi:hypothetical protein